jgi:exodeoxyribonuclease V alpha subunit
MARDPELAERFGLDAIDDIQVLSPMYRGETGATALNDRLQDVLNPSGAELQRGRRMQRGRESGA